MDNKKILNYVGFSYAIFGAVGAGVQILFARMIFRLFPEFYSNNAITISLLGVVLAIDILGFGIVSLLLRNVEKCELEMKKLSVSKFIQGIFITFGLVFAGAIIGSIVDGNFQNEGGNGISKIVTESNFFLRVLVVGIGAPVFEELIFRTLLIDRLANCGKVLAVFASGLFFGLYHGNFAQFFFAFFIGLFFAYIYVETGNIKYTIAYHMIINMTTSVITASLINNADLNDVMSPQTVRVALWSMFLLLVGVIGFSIFFANIRKFRINEQGKMKLICIFKSCGMWMFIAVCAFLFYHSYFM